MESEDAIGKQYAILRVITFALFVAAPLCYTAIVYLLSYSGNMPIRPNAPITYAMFALALIHAVLVPACDRFGVWTKKGRGPRREGQSISQRAVSLMIIKMAQIESMYLFGIVTFFVTGLTTYLPYFTALGLLYSIIYWPTRERFVSLVRALEEP